VSQLLSCSLCNQCPQHGHGQLRSFVDWRYRAAKLSTILSAVFIFCAPPPKFGNEKLYVNPLGLPRLPPQFQVRPVSLMSANTVVPTLGLCVGCVWASAERRGRSKMGLWLRVAHTNGFFFFWFCVGFVRVFGAFFIFLTIVCPRLLVR
jgi:hypothetical protein